MPFDYDTRSTPRIVAKNVTNHDRIKIILENNQMITLQFYRQFASGRLDLLVDRYRTDDSFLADIYRTAAYQCAYAKFGSPLKHLKTRLYVRFFSKLQEMREKLLLTVTVFDDDDTPGYSPRVGEVFMLVVSPDYNGRAYFTKTPVRSIEFYAIPGKGVVV